MRKLLILLLLATAAMAENTPRRPAYPADFKPQACAPDAAAVCVAVPAGQLRSHATTFRGYELHQEWIDAHYDEMVKAFQPICAQVANCFTINNNDWVYCLDIVREDFLGQCDRFPAGSADRDQCTMFAMTYYVALGAKTKLHGEAQKCVARQPAATTERTLEAWFTQPSYAVDFDGEVIIHAIDAETRLPVRAKLSTDAEAPLRSTEGPVPTTGYPSKWKARMARVLTADGRRQLVAPTVTVTADGYKPLQLKMPIAVPSFVAEMKPKQLKRGRNKFTVTAKDSVTGKPVRGRVMAGNVALGETGQPLELVLRAGEKRPQIWVMSLYDKYGDVVVTPSGK
jgi:hypothetical protein